MNPMSLYLNLALSRTLGMVHSRYGMAVLGMVTLGMVVLELVVLFLTQKYMVYSLYTVYLNNIDTCLNILLFTFLWIGRSRIFTYQLNSYTPALST
jgi:hypothetical protein